jgi:hypothetical protein
MIELFLGIKESTMEDKWNIKKVLESQGDVHEKVANQSNSKLLSSSPTQSLGPPHIQIDVQIVYDLILDVLYMHGKLRKQPFQ